MLNRRRFLQVSATAASGTVAGCASSAPSKPSSASDHPRLARLGRGAPRRIIHVVSDGMSVGTLSCADHLSRQVRGRGLVWTQLMNQPDIHMGLVDMRSLDSLVTDSAAASSSWGSGARVRNGTLNVDSGGRPLVPLMELFGQAGWHRGLVTTTEITHATPAGFTVAVESRGEGEEIAARYLKSHLDVYLGGAQNHFNPAKRKDKRDLWSDFAAAGFAVLKTRADLEHAPTDRPWLGTFSEGHLPFTLDRDRDPKLQLTVPSIAQMTARALEHLDRHERFILQVEGGRVDHACHNNDAAAALWDQIALDEALEWILHYREEHPETLVVVTTDHGNANLGLNGMGSSYRDSSTCFRRVADIQASFPTILKDLKAAKSETDAAEAFAAHTRLKIDAAKVASILPYVNGKGTALFDQMKTDVAALGQLLANHLGVGFTGTAHTSDYVPLLAVGPGSQRFRGFLRNTEVFANYTDLARIDYRNPEESLLAGVATSRPPEENCAEYALA